MNNMNSSAIVKKRIVSIITYMFLIIVLLLFAFPFYYVFVLATWDDSKIYDGTPKLFFSDALAKNWNRLMEETNFFRNFFNSAGIAVLSTLSTIFFCTMGGFAFACYDFRGKKLLFALTLGSLFIPATLHIIPFFQIIINLRWHKTWLPLIVPGMANAVGIFLMTQYIKSALPKELLDAARIDGVSEFGILMKIVFPLSTAGISVLGILTFVGSWNNFVLASIVLPGSDISTLPVALSELFGRSTGGIAPLMLGNAISLIPLSLGVLFFSRQIIGGLTAGSIKG